MQAALDELGVGYAYVDIHRDETARQRVREINHGCESVPTLVFPDGSTLTEPSQQVLREKLDQAWDPAPLETNLKKPRSAVYVGLFSVGALFIGMGFARNAPVFILVGSLVLVWMGLKLRGV